MNIDLNVPAPDGTEFRALRCLDERPFVSQRELAGELGVSIGKAHYCLRALVDRGLVKVRNYRNSQNKVAYLYLLTPKGAVEKGRIAKRFLEQRLEEYDRLAKEIERLRAESADAAGSTRAAWTQARKR